MLQLRWPKSVTAISIYSRQFQFTHGNCNLYTTISIFFTAPLTEFGVWHALQQKGIRVPRSKVEEIVRELDADGVEARKAHRL